jgi:hypothetical protein
MILRNLIILSLVGLAIPIFSHAGHWHPPAPGTLQAAIHHRNASQAELLLEPGKNYLYGPHSVGTQILKAGFGKLFEIMYEKGSTIPATDSKNLEYLMEFSLRGGDGNLGATKILLDLGANPARFFELSVQVSGPAIVRLLGDRVAYISQPDENGIIPLMYAADVETAKYLLERGADLHTRDKEGNTAFINVCRGGHVEVAQYFHEIGADVFAKNDLGQTALHLAVNPDPEGRRTKLFLRRARLTTTKREIDKHNAKVVRFLLQLGLDKNTKDLNGQTPLTMSTIDLEETQHILKTFTPD